MVLETRYAVGSGLLIGTGQHWLLLGTDPGPRLVDELWALLGGAGPVVDPVLEVLEKHFPDGLPSLALLDLTPGAAGSATRGDGRLTHDGDERLLSVSLAEGPPTRRLVAGVVGAGSAQVRELAAPRRPGPVLESPPAAGRPLIAGVPAHILGASAPEPALSAPTPSVPTPDTEPVAPSGDPDHDGHTTLRSPPVEEARQRSPLVGEATQRSPLVEETRQRRLETPAPDHSLAPSRRHPTNQTVLAARCPAGHVTAAYTPHCRVCDLPVPPQEPRPMPRPRLGVIALPSGEVVPLDRGVVFGRKPAPVPGGESYPHLVHLPGDSTYLSRLHLHLELDGWLVMARDLGSRGGTRLHVPDREPEQIRAHEAYTLEPGHALDLADVYRITFQVTT